MTRLHRILSVLLLGLTLVLATACARQVGFHASYAAMSFDERLARAEAIFTGTVMEVSPTRWNQDSGDYWQDVDAQGEQVRQALPFYTVTLALRETLAGALADKFVTVTILGVSPRAAGFDSAERPLQVGDDAVILARQTELTWRDGSRLVWYLLGDPSESYLVKSADGLYRLPGAVEGLTQAALTAQIAQQRAETR